MTYLDRLNEITSEVSEGVKEQILRGRDLEPWDDYLINEGSDLAEADLFMRMLILPEVKEGSLSIQYDRSSLKSAANAIYKKYGDARYDDGQPLIQRIKL